MAKVVVEEYEPYTDKPVLKKRYEVEVPDPKPTIEDRLAALEKKVVQWA